jgi:DNA repair exonuclease SbcCD ATPase subunit
MKRASTIVSVIVAVVVLVAAFAVGLCIREMRFRRAGAEPKGAETQKQIVASQPQTSQPPAGPMFGPGGPDRQRGPSAEQRSGMVDDRAAMRDRFENMSEEEREKFRSQMRDRFSGGGRRRGGGGEMPQNLTEQQRTEMREQMEKLREQWETMSEEEREQTMAQMREKYGFTPRMGFGGRPGGRPGGAEGGRRPPGGGEAPR